MQVDEIKQLVRDVPDFPKKGIIFKDITTVLKNGDALSSSLDLMLDAVKDEKIDLIIGIESRGFIFAPLMAYKLNVGFAPIRKKGKLPSETDSVTYSLEYGEDTIEIHKDAISAGMNVLIVDDLLATGGTSAAAAKLVEKLGGNIVAFSFLIELDFLKGRKQVENYKVYSILNY